MSKNDVLGKDGLPVDRLAIEIRELLNSEHVIQLEELCSYIDSLHELLERAADRIDDLRATLNCYETDTGCRSEG